MDNTPNNIESSLIKRKQSYFYLYLVWVILSIAFSIAGIIYFLSGWKDFIKLEESIQIPDTPIAESLPLTDDDSISIQWNCLDYFNWTEQEKNELSRFVTTFAPEWCYVYELASSSMLSNIQIVWQSWTLYSEGTTSLSLNDIISGRLYEQMLAKSWKSVEQTGESNQGKCIGIDPSFSNSVKYFDRKCQYNDAFSRDVIDALRKAINTKWYKFFQAKWVWNWLVIQDSPDIWFFQSSDGSYPGWTTSFIPGQYFRWPDGATSFSGSTEYSRRSTFLESIFNPTRYTIDRYCIFQNSVFWEFTYHDCTFLSKSDGTKVDFTQIPSSVFSY